ncbi:4-hydroxy-3-methylbut-2-enyl diphosphate reductase [candidate division WOR-1 bacterium RIFOXYB2_FULL_42_35]|uniref:4-hydroxy-3-methylbut-2-enyl diphosphate reductase n=1 Tax=candidate division WOR-1 bacterium RIFOXYC2_FULL_41_25 TaxID=1802586 RepID=A0A1F4TK59_UNCSA|nr:MAG: 4-hydroxy-3-methylbut-2-enyl diphosphate reductase [candidate division WOR-1 bacterium RIFOXYA2_FULL_41_14]OGC23464.1 MAG: 4-hydroxy-3-methylbut-2-enyl diphosphate reductase [candidate division WOR-1 bacterium RIFOXYB2_FULL_42_35]OGC32987.1 MAG: 4-hydroxy-3-methylbut-2-enyl diphosphate reductase [candidate division WOR-1 bacterium RIFOXYC2_FULL_41_25]OGC44110.1 MAG: 4-hydroxy-3-methylbut-2-enyl diphosphate reductase [candidate division WOR-1 bacterium RIFOXYD2_FULL_41_8]
MPILTAKHAGFCEGVERAYRIALKEIEADKNVFMLGNLVHNTQVVDKFKKLGIKNIKDLSEISPGTTGTLILSAHGVPPEVYEQAKVLGLKIVDTTCPWVKKPQRIAQQLAQEGWQVIIVGDKGHPEVKGLVGWSGGTAIVVQSVDELKQVRLDQEKPLGVLAQTTQSEESFSSIIAYLKQNFKNVKEQNTICGATEKRQSSAIDLAKRVDLILIVGDKMSANTKRLTELCSKTGTETHQIQTAEELNLAWLKGKEKVGITAGASTPDWVIWEVEQKLKTC